MNNVNKTLYIPLYGKALVSRKGILLKDPKAEEIWAAEGFSLKGKAKSKWLAYNMGMRSAVFDRWVQKKLEAHPEAVVLHLGCGMDSRVLRLDRKESVWFDVDFPAVIQERKRYFSEMPGYRMLSSDIRELSWLDAVPDASHAIVVMEGISMYLQPEELKAVLRGIAGVFDTAEIFMDSYTVFGAKATKYKNPINEVGVTEVYGMDDPRQLEEAGICFVAEHDLTPEDMVNVLQGFEKWFFQKMFAGSFAKKIYRLYEYRIGCL